MKTLPNVSMLFSNIILNNKNVSIFYTDGRPFNTIGNNYHAKRDRALFRFKKDNYRCIHTVYSTNDAMGEFDCYWYEEPKDLPFLADNSDSKYNPYNRLSSFK